MELQRFDKAFAFLFKALAIASYGSLNDENDKKLARLSANSFYTKKIVQSQTIILRDIGLWYMNHNRFKDAANQFKRSLTFVESSPQQNRLLKLE